MNFILNLSNLALFSYIFIGIISVILPGLIITFGYSDWWIIGFLVVILIFFDKGFRWFRQVSSLSWVQWIGGVLFVRFCLLNGLDNLFSLAALDASIALMGASFKEFSQWILFLGLLLVVGKRQHIREPYLLGSLIGTAISGSVALLQWWFGDLPTPFSLGSFWLHLNRMRGTFTDPNAFGVTAALLLPLFIRRWRWVFIPPICVGAMFSGSRSFFLGLSVLALVSFANLIRRRVAAGYLNNVSILLIFASGVSIFLILVQFLNLSYLPFWIPQSVVRVIETINWSTAAQAWSSRGIFWQIAIRMWYDSPLFGVGFGNFRQELPAYAQLLGIDLKGWLDNSNSFYLGTLAEQGVVGACLFGFLIWQLVGRSNEAADGNSRSVIKEARLAALLLLVLLIVGTHLSFTEVSMTTAVLISPLVAKSATHKWSLKPVMVTLSLIICVAWYEFRRDRGVFDWEFDRERYYRWTSARAVLWIPCKSEGISHLFLRSGYPHGDFTVRVAELETALLPGVWTEVSVPCVSNWFNQSISGALSPVIVSVSRPWRPSEIFMSEDIRRLGVQVSFNSMLQKDFGASPSLMFPSLRWSSPKTSVIW